MATGEAKLITCILPKGRGRPLLQALIDQKGIHSANVHHARGVGRFTPLALRGVGEQAEKEIVDIAIPAEQADEVFEFVFFEAEINKPHGGIVYMSSLVSASAFRLPEVKSTDAAS